ncbi:uncharacterized protein LOC144352039 [Saccoglossus kowalevskii]
MSSMATSPKSASNEEFSDDEDEMNSESALLIQMATTLIRLMNVHRRCQQAHRSQEEMEKKKTL